MLSSSFLPLLSWIQSSVMDRIASDLKCLTLPVTQCQQHFFIYFSGYHTLLVLVFFSLRAGFSSSLNFGVSQGLVLGLLHFTLMFLLISPSFLDLMSLCWKSKFNLHPRSFLWIPVNEMELLLPVVGIWFYGLREFGEDGALLLKWEEFSCYN